MRWEVAAENLAFPEGMAWSEASQSLMLTAVAAGAVYRLSWGTTWQLELVADVLGCANGCAVAEDETCVVAQNGNAGGWVHARLGRRWPGRFTPTAETPPGIQLIRNDGSVAYLVDSGFVAPNDIAATPDGGLVLTDPGLPPETEHEHNGRVVRLAPDGTVSVLAERLHYPNGIVATASGAVLFTERQGVMRIPAGGDAEWLTPDVGGRVDGLAVDVTGTVYVSGRDGIQLIEPDGALAEFMPLPATSTSNCCFGGPDLSWLFVADALNGTVLACRDMPHPGAATYRWTPVMTESSNHRPTDAD